MHSADRCSRIAGEVPPATVRFRVLETSINAITLGAALDIIDRSIRDDRPTYVNVCNAYTVLCCHDSPALANIVNNSGLSVPDGMPLVWIGRLRGYSVERVYGPDLMAAVCSRGQDSGYRHFFYGTTPETLSRLTAALFARFPRIQIVGAYAPPFRELSEQEKLDVASIINNAHPHIVWVGMSTPKQDYWMGEFRPMLTAPVLIAVGAAFDFLAGTAPQSPRWLMKMGLEWLFRLFVEPRRLWRRYILGNPRFFWLVMKQLVPRRTAAPPR